MSGFDMQKTDQSGFEDIRSSQGDSTDSFALEAKMGFGGGGLKRREVEGVGEGGEREKGGREVKLGKRLRVDVENLKEKDPVCEKKVKGESNGECLDL
jgi:hypothetical protein